MAAAVRRSDRVQGGPAARSASGSVPSGAPPGFDRETRAVGRTVACTTGGRHVQRPQAGPPGRTSAAGPPGRTSALQTGPPGRTSAAGPLRAYTARCASSSTAEQRTLNPQVVGSNPTRRTFFLVAGLGNRSRGRNDRLADRLAHFDLAGEGSVPPQNVGHGERDLASRHVRGAWSADAEPGPQSTEQGASACRAGGLRRPERGQPG